MALEHPDCSYFSASDALTVWASERGTQHLVYADRALQRCSLLISHSWHECPCTSATCQNLKEPGAFIQASAGGSAGKSDLGLNISWSESEVRRLASPIKDRSLLHADCVLASLVCTQKDALDAALMQQSANCERLDLHSRSDKGALVM
eukprot:1797142-Pleurochrysis_carterae.AAC.1